MSTLSPAEQQIRELASAPVRPRKRWPRSRPRASTTCSTKSPPSSRRTRKPSSPPTPSTSPRPKGRHPRLTHRPPAHHREIARLHGQGRAPGPLAAPAPRAKAGRVDPPQRHRHLENPRAHRRHRHHLRVPPQRHHRRRRALPQDWQRHRAARRQGSYPLQPRAHRRAGQLQDAAQGCRSAHRQRRPRAHPLPLPPERPHRSHHPPRRPRPDRDRRRELAHSRHQARPRWSAPSSSTPRPTSTWPSPS